MKDFKNMKDTDLDKLFQESADQSVPDFNESSWDKMVALLDDTEAPVVTWWKKPLIYSSIILLLLSISYVGFKLFDKNTAKISILKTTKVESIGGDSNLSEGLNPLSSLKNERTTGNPLEENFEKELLSGTEQLAGNMPKLNHEKNRSGVKGSTADLKKRELLNRLGEDLGDDVSASKKSVKPNSEKGVKRSSGNTNKGDVLEKGLGADFSKPSSKNELTLENKKPLYEQLNRGDIVSLTKLSRKDFVPFEIKLHPHIILSPEKVSLEVNEEEKMLKGFALRFAFSPDFSVVPENSFFKIGHNWAALLEHRFNNKWSIQTGVIKSLKFYQASPAQYKWPETWGNAPAELNQIDARCSMIDIPLNIRYDFTNTRNRWFAQAGFTSYLMLKENYEYIFASNYNDQVWKSWEGKTGFYAAGVINVSGGLEKRLFNKMSIQVEPFFKIPVGNVGYGKVKLATAGLFISTKVPLRN
ncbi:hypothetical protein [uncultured Arcticibacterium sp.]|uniref:hypothetical protein n=1 Tax=uncultured Arcticibacterium sp. TaxID=2173042 RepID=UPI0030FC711B